MNGRDMTYQEFKKEREKRERTTSEALTAGRSMNALTSERKIADYQLVEIEERARAYAAHDCGSFGSAYKTINGAVVKCKTRRKKGGYVSTWYLDGQRTSREKVLDALCNVARADDTSIAAVQALIETAKGHAINLEQCAAFIESEPLARAMTSAALFLRSLAEDGGQALLKLRAIG